VTAAAAAAAAAAAGGGGGGVVQAAGAVAGRGVVMDAGMCSNCARGVGCAANPDLETVAGALTYNCWHHHGIAEHAVCAIPLHLTDESMELPDHPALVLLLCAGCCWWWRAV
jgi:hypothetical protein